MVHYFIQLQLQQLILFKNQHFRDYMHIIILRLVVIQINRYITIQPNYILVVRRQV